MLQTKTRLSILNLISFIAIHPQTIEMQRWTDYTMQSNGLLNDKKNFSCGSVGCIAGLTVALESPIGITPEYESMLYVKYTNELDLDSTPSVFNGIALEAKNILGLTTNEAKQLFLPEYWPYEFRKQLQSFPTAHAGNLRTELTAFRYAQLIISRLQFFLDTDGTDVSVETA